MPRISVIVPVYNVEPYLHRCVDSILAQTFTDFELILVDDGSPDNCGQICDEYDEKDNRVHVVHQENSGLSAARNAGIDWAFTNSDSKWLSFIDSDDWIDPSFLQRLYIAANEMNVSISACGFLRVTVFESSIPAEGSVVNYVWDEFYLKNPVVAAIAVNKLYDKQLFKGIRYPEGRLHEDEFVTYKLLYQAEKVSFVPMDLYYYYQNPESIMRKPYTLKRLDAIDALGEQSKFFKKIGNKQLYYFCVKRQLNVIRMNLQKIEENHLYLGNGWKNKKKRLKRLQKRILAKNGKVIAPRSENQWLYDEAFPIENWVGWTVKGVVKKIKKTVGRDVKD